MRNAVFAVARAVQELRFLEYSGGGNSRKNKVAYLPYFGRRETKSSNDNRCGGQCRTPYKNSQRGAEQGAGRRYRAGLGYLDRRRTRDWEIYTAPAACPENEEKNTLCFRRGECITDKNESGQAYRNPKPKLFPLHRDFGGENPFRGEKTSAGFCDYRQYTDASVPADREFARDSFAD